LNEAMADVDDQMQELCGVSLSAIDSSQDTAQDLLQQRLLAVERAVLESDTKSLAAAQLEVQDGNELAPLLAMAKLLCEGEYADVIRLPQAQNLLQKTVAELCSDEQDENAHICGSVAEALQSYLLDQCDGAESRMVAAYEILLIGIAFFNMYVQANYTGPAFEKETLRDVLDLASRLVTCSTTSDDKKSHSEALVALQVDGESPFSICEYPQFLLVGRCLLDFVGNHAYNDWSVAANDIVRGQNDNEVSDDAVEGPAKCQVTGGAAIRALSEMLEQIKSAAWWNARAAVAHERLLLSKQPSNTLWFEARRGYIQTLKMTELFAFEKETQYLLARAYVEWGLAQHHFDKNKHGKATFARAKEISGVSVQMSGSMGKRTKFQQKSVAQMVLLAASKKEPQSADKETSVYATAVAESTHVDFGGRQVTSEEGDNSSEPPAAAPPADGLTAEEEHLQKLVNEGEASYRNVNLDQVDQDNYLLEHIAFEDRKLTEQGNLQLVDQIVLLGLCLDVKNSNGNDGLTREEMMPYVTRVLENPNNWMVYSTALLERAWLECESSKRRERAVLQMQALVDQHTTRLTITQNTLQSIADSAPARERMQFVYSLAFPPRYALKRDLAERYFKLGVLGSAVEICEELEMWDDVVKCYQLLDKPMRAEKLVRERLEVAPTPFMWVTLGDLTQEPSHYETSWTLSKQRFARAKRSLGRYYFEKGDVEAAIPHYVEAVRVGPMHTGAWFTLGALAMRIHRWALAMRAFTRVVQLEPDNGEAWGNLGSIHLHNQRYAEAFAVLEEALKQKRHMWQMWENYALCAMETRRYGEAMYAMHQLLDMRAKHKRPVDSEMLAWLVEAIVYPDSLKKVQQEADAEAAAAENAVTDDDEDEVDELDDSDDDLAELDEAAAATDATPPRSDSHYKKQLAMLFGRVTSIVTSDAKVWQVYAHFNDGVEGRADKARDCRLKQCRALQVAGWEREQQKVEDLCVAASRLAQDYLDEGTKKALYSCRLYIRGVLKKAQVDFAELESVKSLAAALDEVNAREAQL
jgi:Tfp pilus assembly protein PilF